MNSKILIVDDEPAMSSLMERQFRHKLKEGIYRFVFATDGHDALRMLRAEPDVDMVVTDINMPNMDGLTLLGHVMQMDPCLRTVIVSAYGDMENIRTAMNRGAFDFVTKPVDFKDLERTIDKTLAEVSSARSLHQRHAAMEHDKACLMRYFSPNLVQRLLDNPDQLTLAVERRKLSFLFTDLAGFSPLVDRSDPKAIFMLLNEYMQGMTEIAFQYGGTVDRIVGDALHIMFGAPERQVDHARRAVHCAFELDRFAHEFARRKRQEGAPIGETRIGINTGMSIVGNFGGGTMFDYTAHGTAINMTERLQSANKRLGTRICVSEHTAQEIEGFTGRPVGRLWLKGSVSPLLAYDPIADGGADTDALTAYLGAFALLEKEDPGAEEALTQVMESYQGPESELAALHLRRLRSGETGIEINLAG